MNKKDKLLLIVFVKRNKKLFSKIFISSFFFYSLLGFYGFGYAGYEKLSLIRAVGNVEQDILIGGNLLWKFNLNNISGSGDFVKDWLSLRVNWEGLINEDSLIFMLRANTDSTEYRIGIDVLNGTDNTKKSTVLNNSILFGSVYINISTFDIKTFLPFNLDILINLNSLNILSHSSTNNETFFSELGYYADLNARKMSSLQQYSNYLEEIISSFYSFVGYNDLVSLNTITSNSLGFTLIDPFFEVFRAIILMLTIFTLLLSSWLVELFISYYNKQSQDTLNNMKMRGLTNKQCRSLKFVPPAFFDFVAFILSICLSILIMFVFSFDLIIVLISISLGFFYLIIRRNREKTSIISSSQERNNLKTKIYVILLLLLAFASVLGLNVLHNMIPNWIYSILSNLFILILFYVSLILISELFLFLQYKKKKSGYVKNLSEMISKIIILIRKELKSWFQLTLLLSWIFSTLIISTQTFLYNYELYQEMEYPTDVIIDGCEILLSKVAELEKITEVDQVFCISLSSHTFINQYDLFLMNFTKLEDFFKEYMSLFKINDFQHGITYMSKEMAEKYNFENGESFPTIFGKNITNIVENQPIKIVDYFPLIKKESGRNYIVSDFRGEYENYTNVNKFYINFREGLSIDQGIKALETFFNKTLNVESPEFLSYNGVLNYLICSFFAIALFFGGFEFLALGEHLKSVYYKLSLRGLNKKSLREEFVKTITTLQLFTIAVSFVLSLIYSYIFLPKSIFSISLFTKLQITLNFNLLFLLMIPFQYLVMSYLTKFKIHPA